VVDTGFKLVLSGQVPEVVAANLGGDVDQFLAAHGLVRKDIDRWIAHTGGPKVLEAVRSALGLEDAALAKSWASLRAVGNLSSASVLFVLADELEAGQGLPGELGLLVAMGPGFATELLLLRW
jgi:alkylresorcinol/alkylpyrone synthase